MDAIHPGYGFLSENPALPRACEQAGITFIGPSAELLELLGDKTAARNLAIKAGIPVIPARRTRSPTWQGSVRGANDRLPAHHQGCLRRRRPRHARGRDGRKNSPAESRKRAEAGAAFGNDAVFLERYIRRAKHIEVQILGDRHGNMLHLYERDCSVQRRHQKVVEVAPAVDLDQPNPPRDLRMPPSQLARAAGYYNAGTVEFLVDVDTGEWFFIEVNPRVQVEHTVTEMVTGIDIVRSQILIAQGHKLHGERSLAAAGRDSAPRLRAAVPRHDRGPLEQLHTRLRQDPTYRSPAGFGIRLDGASAYGGAVITPYYDSLLVKVTAWGSDFPQACQRMDRALREFRIRGVKTNIPFLENVVNHATISSRRRDNAFLDDTPELFQFTPRQDRATKLLTYIGDVIVNGNKEVAGKPKPDRLASHPAAARYRASRPPEPVSCCLSSGPKDSPSGRASRPAAPDRHDIP